jgi:D-beta-D-heptose 7-phosphate kinase/D-beta-D-heptose 1-phosphate adenosyltransferase
MTKDMSNEAKKVIIVSGYYSPCHEGHIEYVRLAKEFVGKDGVVYVIVNNDNQSILKKGFSFVPEKDRLAIMDALKYVDKAYLSIDTDRTVCNTIEWICNNAEYKPTHFGNGGDVTTDNPSPEDIVCKKNNIKMVYGLGDKIQSSSWILDKSVKDAYNILFGKA